MASEPFHDVALGGSFWQEEAKKKGPSKKQILKFDLRTWRAPGMRW